jgi:ferredoxin
MCSSECPQTLLKQFPRGRKGAVALCSNRSTVRPSVKKGCDLGCIKCGICEKKCPEAAVKLENGVPVIDFAKCTSCGTCVEGCPSKVLTLIA